ncbi:MAG: HAD family hydrolase [Candidatus Methylomirabilia bacterium]
MRLFLFDVDGTLVTARGAGRRAMARAFVEVYGVNGPIDRYDFAGKTDLQIVADLMGAAGVPHREIAARTTAFFERYVEELRAEIGVPERVEVMPGVAEVVVGLAHCPQALVGLLTGNIEAGARVKLEPTGLWQYFRLGAYGSDDPDRIKLLEVALRRAATLVGLAFQPREVVVIGDTPLDIHCARASGAIAAAVATGQHGLEQLAACGPDFLFPDLSDVSRVLATLLDGGAPR